MKRLRLIPFMILPLILSSCDGNGYLGTYSFQLGKDSGTHFGVFATTTNKQYSYTDEGGQVIPLTGSYEMNLRLKLGGASLGSFFDILNINDATVRAYYSIGKALGGEQGSVLNFGFNIKEVLESLLPSDPSSTRIHRDGDTPSEGEEDPVTPIPDDWYDITPEDTAKFVYTTISQSTMVFNLPVSIDDLKFQLYWYGLDLSNLSAEIVAHDIGTHPTPEEVEEINQTYPASHDNKSFRDYHTLSLSLTKK